MVVSAVSNRCLDCDDIITNPICTECLAKKMRIVVAEHDPNLAEDIIESDVHGETTCIKCGKEMGICAHCFSKDVYEMLVYRKYPQTKEFLSRFDFFLRTKLSDYC
jgi:hypothetical protein